jgi:hypothetical protein
MTAFCFKPQLTAFLNRLQISRLFENDRRKTAEWECLQYVPQHKYVGIRVQRVMNVRVQLRAHPYPKWDSILIRPKPNVCKLQRYGGCMEHSIGLCKQSRECAIAHAPPAAVLHAVSVVAHKMWVTSDSIVSKQKEMRLSQGTVSEIVRKRNLLISNSALSLDYFR